MRSGLDWCPDFSAVRVLIRARQGLVGSHFSEIEEKINNDVRVKRDCLVIATRNHFEF